MFPYLKSSMTAARNVLKLVWRSMSSPGLRARLPNTWSNITTYRGGCYTHAVRCDLVQQFEVIRNINININNDCVCLVLVNYYSERGEVRGEERKNHQFSKNERAGWGQLQDTLSTVYVHVIQHQKEVWEWRWGVEWLKTHRNSTSKPPIKVLK